MKRKSIGSLLLLMAAAAFIQLVSASGLLADTVTWTPIIPGRANGRAGFCSVYACEDIPGYGAEKNLAITRIIPYDGWLYLGTYNWSRGAEIWRWDQADVFEPVMTGGWGKAYNQFLHSMIEFRGRLYAGTWIDVPSISPKPGRGMSIWAFDGLEWTPVTEDGFGDSCNDAATSMTLFDDHLFVGVYNPTEGPELWRSADGRSWEPAVADQVDGDDFDADENGFSSPGNSDATVVGVFNDRLHVFTEAARPHDDAEAPQDARDTGTQVWATSASGSPPFDDLVRVNQEGYGNPHGGMNNNTSWNMRSELLVHDGFLYVGTWNWSGSAQIFRTDGIPAAGGTQYVWEEASPPGFGHGHIIAQPLEVFQDYLFASSAGPGGARLWALPLDGDQDRPLEDWICVVADGFGDDDRYRMIPAAHAAEDVLYVSTGTAPLIRSGKGPELWALSFDGPLDADGDGFAGGAFADCDDSDPEVHPDMTEILFNGLDDDCNPRTLDFPVSCGTTVPAIPTLGDGGKPPRHLNLSIGILLPALMLLVRRTFPTKRSPPASDLLAFSRMKR